MNVHVYGIATGVYVSACTHGDQENTISRQRSRSRSRSYSSSLPASPWCFGSRED